MEFTGCLKSLQEFVYEQNKTWNNLQESPKKIDIFPKNDSTNGGCSEK